MSKARIDHVEGSSITLTTTGCEAQRIARVSGLSGAACDRLRAAVNAAGIPHVGDPHPSMDNLFVMAVTAEPDGPTDAMVRISYASRSQPAMAIASGVADTTTLFDADGKRIVRSWSPAGSDDDLQSQWRPVTRLSPRPILRFTRREEASPLPKALRYVGTVNRTAIFGGEPETWLCVGIDAHSPRNPDGGGASRQVTYAFEYNREGWQPRVAYVHPDTGASPADLIDGVGVKVAKVYPVAEFKELGLQL